MALIAAMPVLPAVRKLADDNRVTRALSYVAATVLMLLSLVFLVGQCYNPFIYFRF